MRILNCYMANDSKGHFVTAKEAAKHNRQDVLCCVSCGCPLTLQRGNDGQPPWFEHTDDGLTEHGHECPYVQPEHREVQLIKRLQQLVPDALPVVRKACWYCRQCRHAYYGEQYCTHCQTGRFSEEGVAE